MSNTSVFGYPVLSVELDFTFCGSEEAVKAAIRIAGTLCEQDTHRDNLPTVKFEWNGFP